MKENLDNLFLSPNTNSNTILKSPVSSLTSHLSGQYAPDMNQYYTGKNSQVYIAKVLRHFRTPNSAGRINQRTPLSAANIKPVSPLKNNIFVTPSKNENTLLPKMRRIGGFASPAPSNALGTPAVALKSQMISSPADINDQSYNELVIYKVVSYLRLPNFVHMKEWFKTRDLLHEDSTAGGGDDDENSSNEKWADFEEPSQYMNYILERADLSLRDLVKQKRSLQLPLMRNILFQVCYALHVAQTLCNFGHNDLHFKNVLLKNRPADAKGYLYSLGDDSWLVDCEYVVKINDFGLSTITLPDGREVCNKRSGTFGMSLPHRDLQKIHEELRGLQLTGGTLQERKQWISLRKTMSRMCTPLDILSHPFFDCMRQRDTVEDNKGIGSAAGRIVRIRPHLSGEYQTFTAEHKASMRTVPSPRSTRLRKRTHQSQNCVVQKSKRRQMNALR